MSANTTTSTTDGTAGSNAGQQLGEAVSGLFHAGHGAGEGIRGNINGFLDNVGEQIAGRGGESGVGKAAEPRSGEDNAKVAASGADEMRAGVNKLNQQ